jgi:hypothetical protein
VFALAAEHALILSPRDVGNIRKYVRLKYAELPQEQHAEIVADAVSRTIYRQLPEFGDALRKRMTDSLIRSTVVKEKRPVTAIDVLEESLKLDWRSQELLQPLARWTGSKLAAGLPKERIESILSEVAGAASGDVDAGTAAALLWERLRNAAEEHRAIAGSEYAGAYRAPVVALFATPADAKDRRRQSLLYGLLTMLLVSAMLGYGWMQVRSQAIQSPIGANDPAAAVGQHPESADSMAAASAVSLVAGNELPATHRYRDIDQDKLVAFLELRRSILRTEPYRSVILETARQFDIHPLLLFAITGQEQGFVNEEHEHATEIANNPFNVYHSWQEFNTTIEHSAAVASRTIVRLSRDRPADQDPVQWINREYAEDQKWHIGVNKLFETMKKSIE